MTTLRKKILRNLLVFCFLLLFAYLFVTITYAYERIEYKPLIGLPGLQDSGAKDIPSYINALYLLTIGIGSIIAVLRIAFAGVKYSLSDIVTDKASAKKDIQGVLLGLAILLIPYLVLNQINPNLTNLNVLNVGRTELKVSLPPSGSSGTGGKVLPVVPQTKIQVCNYDPIYQTGCSPEIPCTSPVSYDSFGCSSECSAFQGTFKETSSKSSTCTYLLAPKSTSPREQTPQEEVSNEQADNSFNPN